MNGKKWIRAWTIIIIIIMPFVGGFNYFIDSLGLVNKNGFMERAATDLLNNKILAGLTNYDERYFNKRVLEKFTENKDMLILGSSRSMLIRHRNLKNIYTSFFNASVSNGIFGDIVNMIYIYENNLKTLPNNIIINIDPWLFNKNNPERRYLENVNIFTKMSNKINGNKIGDFPVEVTTNLKNTFEKNILKLFSLEYFFLNFSYLMNQHQDYYIINTADKALMVSIKEPDGSLHYPINNKTKEQISIESSAWLKSNISQFKKFNKISNKKIFENLLKYLLSRNVNIIIHLAPFSPVIYNKLIIKHPLIKEAETFIHKISNQLNIKVIGSYNPYTYTHNIDDFSDHMHSKEKIVNLILNEI